MGCINSVPKTECSFTAFCNEMTHKYQTINILAGPVMTPNSFISWFFSWIAVLKIDFQKEIEPWCQHKPSILACDGTHIGITKMNMNLLKNVTLPDDKETTLKSMHKRYDCVIVRKKEHRKHMQYLSKKYLKKLKRRIFSPSQLKLSGWVNLCSMSS